MRGGMGSGAARHGATVCALCLAIGSGCATTQEIPLGCLTEEIVVYVDGRMLEERPESLELRADQPHKLYFKRPGHDPQLVVLDTDLDDEGRPHLSPADVCVELVPIGLDRRLQIEVEGPDPGEEAGDETP